MAKEWCTKPMGRHPELSEGISWDAHHIYIVIRSYSDILGHVVTPDHPPSTAILPYPT